MRALPASQRAFRSTAPTSGIGTSAYMRFMSQRKTLPGPERRFNLDDPCSTDANSSARSNALNRRKIHIEDAIHDCDQSILELAADIAAHRIVAALQVFLGEQKRLNLVAYLAGDLAVCSKQFVKRQ